MITKEDKMYYERPTDRLELDFPTKAEKPKSEKDYKDPDAVKYFVEKWWWDNSNIGKILHFVYNHSEGVSEIELR